MSDGATMDQGNTQKDPDDWVTGEEPMTGAQRSYLETLSQEAGEEVDDSLTKADASKRIDELQQKTGRGTWRRRESRHSVLEVAAVREDHRDAGRVRGVDDLEVALRPAGLDDRGHARVDRRLGAVGEREEGVRGERGALQLASRLARLVEREADGVDAAHLPRADSHRREPVREHDRVRANVLAHLPAEQHLAPLGLARLALRDDLHLGPILEVEVAVLHEQAAHHALEVALGDVEPPALVVLEYAHVRLRGKHLERLVREARRE